MHDALHELSPPLFRYFRASFPSLLAADLTQDVLVRLLEKCQAGKFDPRQGSLRMYAFGIAHFVRLEQFKLPRPTPSEAEAAFEPDIEERLALRQAIAQLPETEKEIVLLLLDRDLTLDEIGKILTIPLNTVKSHMHRAKQNLRKLLQEDQEHGRT